MRQPRNPAPSRHFIPRPLASLPSSDPWCTSGVGWHEGSRPHGTSSQKTTAHHPRNGWLLRGRHYSATQCTIGHRTLWKITAKLLQRSSTCRQAVLSVWLLPWIFAGMLALTLLMNRGITSHRCWAIKSCRMRRCSPSSKCSLPVSPGMCVNCDVCGEEIMNEREVCQNGLALCRPCAGIAYYQFPVSIPIFENTAV